MEKTKVHVGIHIHSFPLYTYLLQAKILYNTALKGRKSRHLLLEPPEVES